MLVVSVKIIIQFIIFNKLYDFISSTTKSLRSKVTHYFQKWHILPAEFQNPMTYQFLLGLRILAQYTRKQCTNPLLKLWLTYRPYTSNDRNVFSERLTQYRHAARRPFATMVTKSKLMEFIKIIIKIQVDFIFEVPPSPREEMTWFLFKICSRKSWSKFSNI